MVKQSPKAPDPNLPQEQHPALRATAGIDAAVDRMRKRQAQKEFQIEELKVWRDCVISVAATENGQLLLANLVKHAGLFNPPVARDTVRMVEEKCRAAFYVEWVRPFLPPELRIKIE